MVTTRGTMIDLQNMSDFEYKSSKFTYNVYAGESAHCAIQNMKILAKEFNIEVTAVFNYNIVTVYPNETVKIT